MISPYDQNFKNYLNIQASKENFVNKDTGLSEQDFDDIASEENAKYKKKMQGVCKE